MSRVTKTEPSLEHPDYLPPKPRKIHWEDYEVSHEVDKFFEVKEEPKEQSNE